jgi:hypothetical protein
MPGVRLPLVLVVLLPAFSPTAAAERILDSQLHHLRAGFKREWSDFPEQAEGPRLVISFPGTVNRVEHSLRLRQQDVKQTWRVRLNETQLGKLILDENDTAAYFAIPPGAMTDGDNTLLVE